MREPCDAHVVRGGMAAPESVAVIGWGAGPVACPRGWSNPGRALCPPFTLKPPTGGPVSPESQAV